MTTTMKSRAASAATLALFDDPPRPAREALGTGAFVLPGFALPFVDELLPAIRAVEADAPFRHLVTPGGFTMSVALTNCGALGWIDMDPTNNRIVSSDHITLGWGRDYSDICPIRGVFVGGGSHALKVSVDVAPQVA